MSEVICAQTGPANNHHSTRFNQQLLAANKITVVKHSPRSITKQTQTNLFQKARQRANASKKEPSPLKILLKVPGDLMKHPTHGKRRWRLSYQQFATRRWTCKGASKSTGGGREASALCASSAPIRMGPE